MSSSTSTCHLAWAYRIAAACLLLLVTLPFTAPFATCDPGGSVLHAGGADESCDSVKDKVADHFGLAAVGIDVAPAYLSVAGSSVTSVRPRVAETGPALFPLRL